MIVYWEYAFLENALLDGLLLYLAGKCARRRVCIWRLCLAAALGGAFAVVFPLIALPVWAAYFVKVVSGVLICLIACTGGAKACLIAVSAFFAFTFALGGILTAAYSFFGAETAGGTGFYVERAPVALVFAGAGIFVCAALAWLRALYRHRKIRQNLLECTLTAGARTVRWTGFADSGNCLIFRGEPVCVLSAAAVFALFGASPPSVGRMEVGTVNGSAERPVFRIDEICVCGVRRSAYATVGDVGKGYQLILHTALLEECHERIFSAESMAAKDKGRRERRTLSLRKRGASAAAPARGGGGDARQTRSGRRRGDGQGEAR